MAYQSNPQSEGQQQFSSPDAQNSILVASLKELDLELNQRNAAALQELNKEIDELSEIPIDSSTLPRFKDGIDFASFNHHHPSNHPHQEELQKQQRVSVKDNDYKSPENNMGNNFESLQEKLHEMDRNLAHDKTKEDLDAKLKNILDMSKPFTVSKHSNGAQTPMTPFEPMDFGKDSIAEKLVNESFMLPIERKKAQTDIEMNIDDVTRRLQSYSVSIKDEQQPTNGRNVAVESHKIPMPLGYQSNEPSSFPSQYRSFDVSPPMINTTFLPATQPSNTRGNDDNVAIIDALRTLQDRVGKLENEKTHARQKIVSLEKELTTTRSLLLHQQQLNLCSNVELESKQPAKQAPIPSTQSQSEYRVSLPIPDRSTDQTLRRISEARQKVGEVQTELNRLEKLGTRGGPQDPSLAFSANNAANSFENDHSLDDPALLFDEILQKHSIHLLRESQKPKSPRPAALPDTETLTTTNSGAPVKAWEAQEHPATRTKTNTNFERPDVPPAQKEIKKLQESILAERDLRKSELSYDPQVIKEKVLEKLKSSIAKPLEKKKSKSDAPIWKKSESRRSRSVTKESTISTSAHVRKRAPIELPVIPKVAADDNGSREMPFIVGRNTGKSFSVTANLQTVFSLLKSHNPEMCSVCCKRHPQNSKHPHRDAYTESGKPVHVLDHHHHEEPLKRSPSKSGSTKSKSAGSIHPPANSSITNQDLKNAADGVNNDSLFQILGVIEDEYRQAKTKYTHLVKQYETVSNSMTSHAISDSTGTSTLKAIGEDLRHVIQTMEAKSDQIAILREIITSSKSLSLKKEKYRKRTAPAVPAPKRYTMDTATSRSRAREASSGPQKSAAARARSQSPGRALASLSLLKSTLKVQNALGEPK